MPTYAQGPRTQVVRHPTATAITNAHNRADAARMAYSACAPENGSAAVPTTQ